MLNGVGRGEAAVRGFRRRLCGRGADRRGSAGAAFSGVGRRASASICRGGGRGIEELGIGGIVFSGVLL